jgi:hypothetical protein
MDQRVIELVSHLWSIYKITNDGNSRYKYLLFN